MFYKYPRTFYPLAHSTETFRTFDGSEGVCIHHDGLLAEVLRVRGLTPQKRNSGWGEGTEPYMAESQAESLKELHRTIALRRAQ